MKDRFEQIITHFQQELATLLPGRISPSLLENVKITAYGTVTPLQQLASITAQDAQTLLVQPWDVSILKDIERGLREAGRNYNPAVDGTAIRLAFPPLTEEKRKEFVKIMYEMAEQTHVAVKRLREDLMQDLKTKKSNKEISEDTFFSDQKNTQKMVDEYNDSIDNIAQAKEKELLKV